MSAVDYDRDLLDLLDELAELVVVADLGELEAAAGQPGGGDDEVPASGALAAALRLILGEPLVRKHHRTDEGWSWLCPVETCQTWRLGYGSPAACRVGWYAHCADPASGHPRSFLPAWPGSIPCVVTQPVAHPGADPAGLLVALIERGEGVDGEGRPLTLVDCPACAGFPHLVVSGATCVRQMFCPTCGVDPDVDCDRRPEAWRQVQQGAHQRMPGSHAARFAAATAVDEGRAATGDTTVPAAWAPAPAPTKRRRRPAAVRWTHTVRVAATSGDGNPAWKALVFEYVTLGRLSWTDGFTVAHIAFESRKLAEFTANMIAGFYGIPAGRVTVVAGVARPPDLRSRVDAQARKVLAEAGAGGDALAWALGVTAVRHLNLFTGGRLDPRTAATRTHTYGSSAAGVTVECDGGSVRTAGPAGARTVSWTRISKVVGQLPQHIAGEVDEALAELRRYPPGSQEHYRAQCWCRDVVAAVWDACRPGSVPDLDYTVPAERDPTVAVVA